MRWHSPVILRREHREFETGLGKVVRLCLRVSKAGLGDAAQWERLPSMHLSPNAANK